MHKTNPGGEQEENAHNFCKSRYLSGEEEEAQFRRNMDSI